LRGKGAGSRPSLSVERKFTLLLTFIAVSAMNEASVAFWYPQIAYKAARGEVIIGIHVASTPNHR
jgi:hypothetical protein